MQILRKNHNSVNARWAEVPGAHNTHRVELDARSVHIRVGCVPPRRVNDCCGRFGRRRASPWHSSRARRFGQTFELTRTTWSAASTLTLPTAGRAFAYWTVSTAVDGKPLDVDIVQVRMDCFNLDIEIVPFAVSKWMSQEQVVRVIF